MSEINQIKVGDIVYDIADETGRNNFINAKTTILNSTSDDEHIPTAKTTYDYGQQIKTDILNLKTSTINTSSSDEEIPTAKAVYDYIQNNTSTGDNNNFNSDGIDLNNYYAIHTIQIDLNTLSDEIELPFLGGMYNKVASYNRTDGLYQISMKNVDEIMTSPLVNVGALTNSGFDLYAMMFNTLAPLAIIPEQIITSENTIEPGVYC